MTSEITNQLAATNLRCVDGSEFSMDYTDSYRSDATPLAGAHWKDGLTAPTKDARPQTEVRRQWQPVACSV